VTFRDHVRNVVDSQCFQNFIIGVIVLNAITLGLETSPALLRQYGDVLHFLDHLALWIFVVELAARLYAHGLRLFRDPWSCFDFIVVAIALVPSEGALSMLRSLRILRALRLVSKVPSMRGVVSTLLAAIPGMASIAMLLVLMLYVAGVMSTKLFGATTPEYFGNLGTSLFTLFQMMTGEGWPEVANQVMAQHPMAWIFFVIYILLSTFVVLNLFIAVVVSAMDEQEQEESARDQAHLEMVLTEVRALRSELKELRDRYEDTENATPRPG
jgi:voltage-gated sodium channel